MEKMINRLKYRGTPWGDGKHLLWLAPAPDCRVKMLHHDTLAHVNTFVWRMTKFNMEKPW
jgi:hypothetical protein